MYLLPLPSKCLSVQISAGMLLSKKYTNPRRIKCNHNIYCFWLNNKEQRSSNFTPTAVVDNVQYNQAVSSFRHMTHQKQTCALTPLPPPPPPPTPRPFSLWWLIIMIMASVGLVRLWNYALEVLPVAIIFVFSGLNWD